MGRRERIFALKKGGIVFKNINPCRRDGGGEMRRKKMRKYFQAFFAVGLAIFFVLPILGCKNTDGKANPQETRLLCSNTPPIVAGDTVALFVESEVSGTGQCVVESQPEGSNINIASQGAYNFVVNPRVVGTYRFRFSIVDGNKSGSDTMEFEVVSLSVGNCVVNVSAGTITVQSNAGVKQGTHYRFYWAQDNPPVAYSWQDSPVFECEFIAGKTYWMKAEVDNGGITASNSLTSFTVTSPDEPPVEPPPPSDTSIFEDGNQIVAGPITIWKKEGRIEIRNFSSWFTDEGQQALAGGASVRLGGDFDYWVSDPDKPVSIQNNVATVSLGFLEGSQRFSFVAGDNTDPKYWFKIAKLPQIAQDVLGHPAPNDSSNISCALNIQQGMLSRILPVWTPIGPQ